MCFGPVASFSTSAALTVIGTLTLKNVRAKKEILFAAIPLLFAVQAASEGVLYLMFKERVLEHSREAVALFFLFFAYVIWPVLTPLAVYFLEPEKRKRGILCLLLFCGIGTAAYLIFLGATHPLETYPLGHSIRYETTRRPMVLLLFYLGATVVPYFVSSFKAFRFFGLLNLIFCLVSYYFYSKTFDSVWCYFAAVSSSGIYILLRRMHRRKLEPAVPL